jgi:transposase, IS5 family
LTRWGVPVKLYALHAPEVECIGKGKARKPYEFGVKSAVVVSHKDGLMLGARTFPGNPYDGHILSAVLEQATNLTQDIAVTLQHIVVDLGFRGVDADNPDKEIIHRGKFKCLSKQQKRWLKRRTAVEPAIGHLKSDHRMDRCWLKGALGDALHTISCAAGYNLRWLLRAIARLGIGAVFLRLLHAALSQRQAARTSYDASGRVGTSSTNNWIGIVVVKKLIFAHTAQGAF